MQNWTTRLVISLVSALNYLTTSGALGSGDKIDALANLPALTYIGFIIALLTGWVSPSVVKAVGNKVKPGAAASLLIVFMFIPIVVVSTPGCDTMTAVKQMEKPQSYKESLLSAYSTINSVRKQTVFAFNSGTITKAQAKEIKIQTDNLNEQIDAIWNAYDLVNGDLLKCEIIVSGQSLPCQTQSDAVLSTLIKIQSVLRTTQ